MDSQAPAEQLLIPFELRANNYQPNAITESRQEFTEMEKRIVVLAINQLRHVYQTWQPGKNLTLLIPYSELTTSNHTQITSAANTLNTKRIIYQDLSNAKAHKFDFIVPFPRVKSTRIQGKSYLELIMFADVVPDFIELGKRYTSYSLTLMLSLSSTYAQRMYEIIMMFYGRGQKTFTYEVSKLRTALNYPPTHEYFDFKRKALQVAQQEMQQKVNLHFDFTPSKKTGKAVTELRFEVKSAQDLINDDIEADRLMIQALQPHEIAAIARNLIYEYKFTRKQQNKILEDFGLMDIFIRVHTEIHHGKRTVANPTAYIAQSLGFGKTSTKLVTGPKSTGKRKKEAKPVGALLAEVVSSGRS